MNALTLSASRRRDKVVILSALNLGRKSATPVRLGATARLCLALLYMLGCFLGGVTLMALERPLPGLLCLGAMMLPLCRKGGAL